MARGRSNYYLMTNKSGVQVTKGMTVIIDTANDTSFKTTTTGADFRTFGLVADAEIENNALGTIQVFGSIAPVLATSAAVTRGHFITQGTTAGKVIDSGTAAAAGTAPPSGAIGIALTGVGSAGNIVAYLFNTSPGVAAAIGDFLGLSDTPVAYTGAALQIVRVNAGETALEFAVESGGSSSVNYDPDLAPLSPSAFDDEFDDDSIAGAWTQGGSPDICSETEAHGFLHLSRTGSSVSGNLYKTFAPGATAFTVVCKVHGDASGAGSNQVLLAVATSAGAFIVDIGMLNIHAAIVGAAALGGGFTQYDVYNGPGNLGKAYFAITRDTTTNYKCYVSTDGIIWKQLASFSQAGTVDRIYLTCSAFSGTQSHGYYDFMRTFPSQTLVIGRAP